MLTLLLSAFFAIAPNTGELSAQADTINRYNIDRKVVTDFDGSQLVGASIAYYDIVVTNENGKVVRNHIITTQNYLTENNIPTTASVKVISTSKTDSEALSIMGFGEGKDNIIYYVNDKKTDEDKVKEIKPSNIKSISVLKGKAAEAVYGEGTGSGVVVIELK